MNYRDLLQESGQAGRPMLLWMGDDYVELTEAALPDAQYEVRSTEDPAGNRVYERSICFLMIRALHAINPQWRVHIEHSISRGLYCELVGQAATPEIIHQIKFKMQELMAQKLPILPHLLDKEQAVVRFQESGHQEVADLLQGVDFEEIKIYELDGLFGFFYGPLAANTGDLDLFDLVPYHEGFVLMYPSLDQPRAVPQFYPQEKLYEIFRETGDWDEILGVQTLSELNDLIDQGQGQRIAAVAEGLHEKKYAQVADAILAKKGARIVLIAGPSSSGKTTSSRRLAIQLMVNGIQPYTIEMDNYFVDREKTPKLPDGSFDFESIHALKLADFSRDMKALLAGETVTPPVFDFETGLSKPGTESLTIPENGVIIIEGIHGLNPELLADIDDAYKFKFYVSALTQLNMDFHNRISTTDVRKIRRSIRDHHKRGWKPEETLEMFVRVIKGEKANIFPYQEQADAMFNSTLVYELPVLKKHILPLLLEIPKSSPAYDEAKRLITMLQFVRDLPDDLVPANSILREFIGGSYFD